MVTYAKDEMVGITELGKSLGNYLDKVTSHTLEKLTIIRRNKPEAVIVPIEEYERMKKSADILEDIEIAKIINKRVIERDTPVKYVNMDDIENYFKSRDLQTED